jgi:hypothetical protein
MTMRVMGIDPGLQNMGWGVIEVEGARIRHVANGVVHSGQGDLAERLLRLYEQMRAVVAEQAPDAAAVEQTFVNKDAAGTLKLGEEGNRLAVPGQPGQHPLGDMDEVAHSAHVDQNMVAGPVQEPPRHSPDHRPTLFMARASSARAVLALSSSALSSALAMAAVR